MALDDVEAQRRRWEANVEPAKPEDSTWGEAPEVQPVIVHFNDAGDLVDVRFDPA